MDVLTVCGVVPGLGHTHTGLLMTSVSHVDLFTWTSLTKFHAVGLKPQQCIVSQF